MKSERPFGRKKVNVKTWKIDLEGNCAVTSWIFNVKDETYAIGRKIVVENLFVFGGYEDGNCLCIFSIAENSKSIIFYTTLKKVHEIRNWIDIFLNGDNDFDFVRKVLKDETIDYSVE